MSVSFRTHCVSKWLSSRSIFALLALASFLPLNAQFVQQGSKLVGTGASGLPRQGDSVALSSDGNTAIVGGFWDVSGGAVWVYTRSNGVWSQQGSKLTGTGASGQAWQGRAVALSADGNTALVGGPLDDSVNGAAWVFTRTGGVWTQQGPKLVGSGAVGAAEQGWSVALSADGNTAALGGTGDARGVGAVWIYTRSSGIWSQQGQKLVGTGSTASPSQGWSVALSADGNTAVTGGIADNNMAGALWVYTRTAGVWTQQGQKLAGSNLSGQAWLGNAISLSADGNTVLAGGLYDNNQIGAAWVFTRSSAVWSQQGNKLVGAGASGVPNQGSSVAISADGNTAVVGGPNDTNYAGAAWVYVRSSSIWSQKQKLVGTGAAGSAPIQQGTSVAVSGDGNSIMIGGAGDSEYAGAAWVFVQPMLIVTKTHSGNFVQGQSGAAYTIAVANSSNGASTNGDPLTGKVTVTDVAPSANFFNVTLAGAGWTCVQTTCSRFDVLLPGGNYPSITVTGNVAAFATNFSNVVNLTYGASGSSTASDPTVVNAVGSNPTASVFPSSGSGNSQTFTFTIPSATGYQDLAGVQVVINSTLTAVNSCYILFGRPGIISLGGDSGFTFQSTSLGAPAILQNSQCVVLASQTSQSGVGNVVTFTVSVVFKPGFAGAKSVWANSNNLAGVSTGYQALGTYTATASQASFSSFVSPTSGSGQGQTFTFNYFDANGAPDISGAQIVFNSALGAANSCYLLFSANNNISLASDSGSTFSTAPLGKQAVLQNSQCEVFPGLSYQTQSGQNLSVTVFVAFKPGFAGVKNVYTSFNNNAGTSSGFSTVGTWTVPATTTILVKSVSPLAATGPSQPLTFVYEDVAGYGDISGTQVIVNTAQTVLNSCSIRLTPTTGVLALATDDGMSSTTATVGQPAILQNSQCIVNAASSTQFGAGNHLTVTVFITMKTSGSQIVYSGVTGASTNAPLAQIGTWNVTSPSTMMPVSVTPFTGSGATGTTQFLTVTLSNPAGASAISGALLVLYPSLQGVGSCYILWGHTTNLISLASDDALTFSSGAAGTSTLLTNSQCTVDPAQSFSVQTGNTVNLTLAVAFKAPLQQFTQLYSWVNVQDQAAVLSGWFVESRFTVQ